MRRSSGLVVAGKRAVRALALLVLPAVALATVTFHQQWQFSTRDVGRSATQLADGGYIASGGCEFSPGVYGVALARTNELGDTTSVRLLAGLNADGGFSCRLADGGYAVLAESARKIFVRKYGPAGESAWDYRSTWGGPISVFIPTADGGCLIAGRIPDTAYDMGVVKLAADGREEWARYYDEPRMDQSWARGVSQTRDSGYILCGDASNYTSVNIRLVRLRSNGDTLWTRLYHGPVGPMLTDARELSDGGFLAVGYELDTLNSRAALYMLRTNPRGDIVWTRTLAPGAAARAAAMCATGDGGFAIVGYIDWTDSCRAWLVKTDSAGDTLWTRALDGRGREAGADVEPTADGGYIVAGTSDSAGGSTLLIKVDSSGSLLGLEDREPLARARLSLSTTPNPAHGIVTLACSPLSSEANVRIFDVTGRAILRSPLAVRQSPFAIKLRSVPAGVYLLRLECAGSYATRKLVVE